METKTWNQYTIKTGNKSVVLETILSSSPISRAEIASQTGLNKGTVSSQVSELLKEELIYEQGPGKSSGGRRPVMLLFNENAGYSIGIDIGVNYILGIRTDLKGNISDEHYVNLTNHDYNHVMEQLQEMIQKLRGSAPASKYGMVGIGIGVPGAVSKEGKILLAPNLGWKNVDLKSDLIQKYDCPILIENEANAGAYGVKKFKEDADGDDLVYISVGVGIGVGLILNGTLYRGNNGFSGEMGHMTIEVNGAECRCGNKGCWELYASEQALYRSAEELQISRDEDILETMIQRAEKEDQTAIDTFQTIGEYLGVGLINIINSFNPQQVIIGNRMGAAKKWIQQPLLKRAKTNALWFQRDDLRIRFSDVSESTALGVAAFSAENFLKVDMDPAAPSPTN